MRPALPLPEGNASEGKWWKGGRGKKKRKGRGKGEKIRKSETEALARPLAGEGWRERERMHDSRMCSYLSVNKSLEQHSGVIHPSSAF